MPKKLFAVTNLKVSNEEGGFMPAGSEVDASKFTKEQLVELHEAGAVEVRIVDDEKTEELVSPLDNPDVDVVDATAAGKAKTEKEEAEAKKAAIDAELKAKEDALKAEAKAREEAAKAQTKTDAEAKAQAQAAAAGAATPPAPSTAPGASPANLKADAETTKSAATTKPEDKK